MKQEKLKEFIDEVIKEFSVEIEVKVNGIKGMEEEKEKLEKKWFLTHRNRIRKNLLMQILPKLKDLEIELKNLEIDFEKKLDVILNKEFNFKMLIKSQEEK